MTTPTLQAGVECDIVYAAESTLATPPSAGGTSQKLRKVQSSINVAAAPFQSAEFASHQQIADMRHGMRAAGGAIDGELSNNTYDDWFEAAMRGTWTSGSTTGSSTLGADNSTSSITRASGSFITDGFKVGDIVRATGFAGGGATNNNVNYRITALTALNMTVDTAPATITGASGVTVAVVGKKLLMGTSKRSFCIEQTYPTIDVSERFDGCRIGGFSLRIPPNGMASVSWPILGINGTNLSGASAPYFTAATSETTTNLMAGTSGIVRVNGADTLVATGIEFNLNLNLSNTPVIGSNVAPEIFYGQMVASGSFSAYFESAALADAFLAETEIDLQAVLYTVDATPASFYNVYARRVKLMGIQKTLTPNGGVVATYPWQALRKVGGAATVYDTSSLVIQRSNT